MAPPPVTRTTLPLPLPVGPPPLPPPVGAPQAMVYCVPPRAMSVLALTPAVNVCPRRPASTAPDASGAWPVGSSAFSLASATFTVTVPLAASNNPSSAAPCRVYVIEPSPLRTAVPKENVEGWVGSVEARK